MKFKFRYDSVLAVKELLISEKEKELRHLNVKIEKKKMLIQKLEDENLHLFERNAQRNMRSSELRSLKNYQNYLIEKEKRERELLKTLMYQREKLIAKISEMSKEKKIIEKLKEKYFQNYLAEENKKDEKAMNEFAVQSFIRRR